MRLKRDLWGMLGDANIWSGIYRGRAGVPTLLVTVRPRYWSLPCSLTFEGCIIGRFGFTVGIGPIYASWSKV